jgi:hypothetical protein
MLDRPADSECNEVAAFDAAGRIVAMLAPHGENKLRPTVNFAPAMLAAQD